jgi:hypothetical protein
MSCQLLSDLIAFCTSDEAIEFNPPGISIERDVGLAKFGFDRDTRTGEDLFDTFGMQRSLTVAIERGYTNV